MVSSSGDENKSQAMDSGDFAAAAKPKPAWANLIDAEQVFRLIDSILPFEACLYHQILPLSLEGSRLKLGMVNLDDSAALDYVRRILAYMNCSLVPQTLASEVHHSVLSAYLNYTGNQKKNVNSRSSAQTQSVVKRIERKLAQESSRINTAETSSTPTDKPVREVLVTDVELDQNNKPTFLVDSPEDLNFQDLEVASPNVPSPSIPTGPDPGTFPDENAASTQGNLVPVDMAAQPRSTLILNAESEAANPPPEIPPPGDSLPLLEISGKHLSDPVETLATLPPAQLLQELLARVLMGGIGRLYLERQQTHGRILWSQNGVLQSVLEELPVDVIQGTINELKLLTRMPLIPVQKPKQVEIERLYQRHRLLLRLRVMPGNHGEEATVQVLRGAALKFYQQQQLANLSRDALGIAQELQRKVNEIRVRSRFYPIIGQDQLNVLPALTSILKNVEQQLQALESLPLLESEDDD